MAKVEVIIPGGQIAGLEQANTIYLSKVDILYWLAKLEMEYRNANAVEDVPETIKAIRTSLENLQKG